MADEQTTDPASSDSPIASPTTVDARAVPTPSISADSQAAQTSQTIDPAYVQATITNESSNNSNATSYDKYGKPIARGLMQLTDTTGNAEFQKLQKSGDIAPDAQYTPYDPAQNKQIGSAYLSEQETDFKDKRLASAAYNAGPSEVRSLIKQYGNSYEDIAAHLPIETQKYVARVAGSYNNLKSQDGSANSSDTQQPEQKYAALPSTIQSAPSSAQGFAKSALVVTQDPDFATLPVQNQADLLTQVYNSKNWGREGYNTYKDTMSKIWQTADPEDLPDLSKEVGAPPVIASGENPVAVLSKWKDNATQRIIQGGKTPGYYGDRLDNYFNNASKAETDAYGIRNEGLASELTYGAGNLVRGAAKGVLSNVTNAVAYGVRANASMNNIINPPTEDVTNSGKTPLQIAQERADYIQNLPNVLGNPSNTYKYATDPKTGKLQLNPDGTPRLKAQEAASLTADSVGQAIGQIGGLLVGGWALKAYGAGAGLTSAVIGGTNALNLANSSYQTVYNDTNGDANKALTASLMAAPVGFVGELGQLKVLSKEISPVIETMTASDKALYVAKSLAKSGATNAAIGAGMDVAQQGVESLQTGQSYNPGRTEESALTSGVAGALVGSIHDYVAGQVNSYAQGKMKAVGDAALVDFRNSTDGSRVLQVPAVSKDLIDSLGMDVVGNNNGTVTVTKKGFVPPENATIPDLVNALRSTYSSDDIKTLGARQAELSTKENKTPEEADELTDLNKTLTKVSEPEYQNGVKAIENAIENHPDRPSLLVDRDPETNLWQHTENGDESLSLKDILFPKAPEVTRDLSDISKLKVIDEDALNATPESAPPKAAATEENINLQRSLDKINSDLLDLRNQKDQIPVDDKEGRKSAQAAINAKIQQRRDVQSNQLKLKPALDTEQAEQEKVTQANKDKEVSIKKIQSVKKAGAVGLYDSRDHSITILSHDSPEVKLETVAHELAHGLAKDLNLSKSANDAINEHVKDLEASFPVSTVQDIVNKTFLPKGAERALRNVPKDAPTTKLNKNGKNAILDRDEVIANQVGAIMLKRAGKDIGNFKILPEIEASLKNTKLPDVNEVLKGYKSEQSAKQEQYIQPKGASNSTQEVAQTGTIPAEPNIKTANSIQEGQEVTRNSNTPEFDTGTAKFGQTAFSKKVTDINPNIPKTMFERQSKELGQIAAKAHIEKTGLDETIKYLSSPESFDMAPKDRSALLEEAYAQRQAIANANPTPKTLEDANIALQLREKAGTPFAQGLAFLRKFRNSDTFTDLIANINRAYTDAGIKPPEYTQAMIDELRGNFDKANKLPKGSKARDAEVDKVFNKTLKLNKTDWGSFLSKYIRTNLLSGAGTQLVVANSSLYMGPVLTALAHPIQGGALTWRAMWQAKGLAASNFRAALAGEGGKALFNGIYDPSPVNMGENPTVESGFAKMYSKFGDNFLNALSATHGFAKTLSAEGFLASKGYADLKAQYGNDPAKFSAEVSKLILKPADIETAKQQAMDEYKQAGITPKAGAIGARAYEILRTDSHSPEQLATAEDYARGVSHAGDMGNVTHQMALQFFNSSFFKHPFLAPVKFITQPFGRAMLALSDYAIDYIPGNFAIDPALRGLGNALDKVRGGDGTYIKPRSEALQTRLRNAQAVGAALSATLLGASRSGLFRLTGDTEKSDVEGEGEDFEGGKATNRADFAEAKQKGDPEYSIIFPNGFALSYKDLPGLNALAYGIWKANKTIDSGPEGHPIANTAIAAAQFYKGAFGYAMPFLGGGTLNSPIYTLADAILNPETDSKKVQDAAQASAERWDSFYKQSADTAVKFFVPFSSFLRDAQQVYDQPEESHQDLIQRAFRNVPGAATLVGSQNAVDRFGDPVKRSSEEHVPGLSRIAGSVTPESGDVWDKLNAKGLTVEEMGNYINFHQSAVAPNGISKDAKSSIFYNYKKTREERVGSAYAKTLTPEEWNDFRKATGPYIKTVANNIADADIPHDDAQALLTKRIDSIEQEALKRYVKTGSFGP